MKAAKKHSFSRPDPKVLWERFRDIRRVLPQLSLSLKVEDCALSTTAETSPPKWHLAHTTWFFEHFFLRQWEPDFRAHDPAYHYLFNSYYQTVGAFLPKSQRGLLSRPTLGEVLFYRQSIDARVEVVLGGARMRDLPAMERILRLGLEHEQQHQELFLMDVKQNFYLQPLRPAFREKNLPSPLADTKPSELWQEISGGNFSIGAHSGEEFSFDNEGARHRVWLEPFQLATGLVSNADYLKFIEDGAYKNPRWWLSDGWDWMQEQKISAPLYWEKNGSEWELMTLYGMRVLEPMEPVAHLSYYEAQAFARWSDCRLPTEAEWEVAASRELVEGQFLEREHFHPELLPKPVGISQLHGTLWEWTQSAYLPYPRYQPFADELAEYNGKFFSGQMVLRGGSCVTPISHYRPSYRNFYYPQMRWQFSGLRLAKDL